MNGNPDACAAAAHLGRTPPTAAESQAAGGAGPGPQQARQPDGVGASRKAQIGSMHTGR